MTERTKSTGRLTTGTVLVLWTLSLPGLWLATFLPGATPSPLVVGFLLPGSSA